MAALICARYLSESIKLAWASLREASDIVSLPVARSSKASAEAFKAPRSPIADEATRLELAWFASIWDVCRWLCESLSDHGYEKPLDVPDDDDEE